MALVLFMRMMRFMTLLTFQNQNEFDNISKLSQLTENGPAIEISVMMILFYKNVPVLAKVPGTHASNFEITLVDNGCLDKT